MALDGGDPWNWTVDQVVEHLCFTPEIWIERPFSEPPPSEALAELLRENQINGSTLLDEVTPGVLRDDLGIKSIGQRAAMNWAIKQLQGRSKRFEENARREKLGQLHHPMLGLTPAFAQSLVTDVKRELQSPLGLATRRSPVNLEYDFEANGPSGSRIGPGESLAVDDAGRTRRDLTLAPGINTLFNPSGDREANISLTGTRIRSGESLTVDDTGRKRRKLTLAQRPVSRSSSPKRGARAPFLCAQKQTVDSIFFGKTKLGEKVASDDEEDEGQDAFQFQFVHSPSEVRHRGSQQYVHRQMRHFLGNPEESAITRERDGAQLLVLHPYRDGIHAGDNRSAFVFKSTSAGDNVSVSREIVKLMDIGYADHDDDSQQHGNSYGFLRDWTDKAGGDEVFPLFGDSDSETVSDTFAEELEQEEAENRAFAANQAKKLSKAEVDKAIDDTFDAYALEWKARKQGIREHGAWKLWPQHSRHRAELIKMASKTVESYTERIAKNKIHMLDNEYNDLAEVTSACENTQVTVFEREEERFKISVWQRDQPPQRPGTILVRKKAKDVRVGDDGDIDLSEGSDLDDFFEQDETMGAVDERSTTGGAGLGPSQSLQSEPMDLDSPANLNSPTLPVDLVSDTESENDIVINAPDDKVTSWSWGDTEQNTFRKALMTKLLRTLPAETYSTLRERVFKTDPDRFRAETYAAIEAMAKGSRTIPGDEGMTDQAIALVFDFARLSICWHECDHKFWDGVDEAVAASHLDNKESLKQSIAESSAVTRKVFEAHAQAIGDNSSQLAVIDEDDEDDEEVSDSFAQEVFIRNGKNRLLDKTAAERRAKAYRRHEQSQVQTQQFLAQYQDEMFSDNNDNEQLIRVNTDENDEEMQVFVHGTIASKLRVHQIEGIQFLWREVVEGETGCLLAHTMGLGKTMQAITFLHTIRRVSKDATLATLLPKHLRKDKLCTLILCPPALINNWLEEIHKWLPGTLVQVLGPVKFIDSVVPPAYRLEVAKEWKKNGGVLVMGYALFSSSVNEPRHAAGTTGLKKNKREERFSEELQRILLQGPDLVIADEAHKMKSNTSLVSIGTSRIKTPSRIALTGSPLANNLLEYYAMIEWVDRGYLGEADEFRSRFANPIQNGLYKDANIPNKRKALKQLAVLIREIAPKVNRKDIQTLKGTLKPKTEFVLTLVLTDTQKKLYNAVIDTALSGVTDKRDLNTSRIWGWMFLLKLICNHPHALRLKLEDIAAGKTGKSKALKPDEDADEAALNFPPSLIIRLKSILDQARGEDAPAARGSIKMRLLMSIIICAREAKDRVLVFTHSMQTLDFLQDYLKAHSISFLRLDGATLTSNRQQMSKDFNSPKGKADVLIISTKAGGTGFNLPGANRVIILDFQFNPQDEEQAVGRSYRLGQEKPVFVYRFVTGDTYEVPLYNQAVFKTQLSLRAVEKKKITSRATKMSEYLFRVGEDLPSQDLSEHIGKDPLVLDRLLKCKSDQSLIKSIETTEVLQTETKDEELTPEEQGEVDEMFKIQRMRRENPQGYEKLQRMQLAQANPVVMHAWRQLQAPFVAQMSRAAESARHEPPPARAPWRIYAPPQIPTTRMPLGSPIGFASADAGTLVADSVPLETAPKTPPPPQKEVLPPAAPTARKYGSTFGSMNLARSSLDKSTATQSPQSARRRVEDVEPAPMKSDAGSKRDGTFESDALQSVAPESSARIPRPNGMTDGASKKQGDTPSEPSRAAAPKTPKPTEPGILAASGILADSSKSEIVDLTLDTSDEASPARHKKKKRVRNSESMAVRSVPRDPSDRRAKSMTNRLDGAFDLPPRRSEASNGDKSRGERKGESKRESKSERKERKRKSKSRSKDDSQGPVDERPKSPTDDGISGDDAYDFMRIASQRFKRPEEI